MEVLFKSRNCLTKDEVKQYILNTLTVEARYSVENHLIECPLCNTAIEGYTQYYDFTKSKELEKLESALQTNSQLRKEKTSHFFKYNRIAATIIFLIVSSAIFSYWNNSKNERLFTKYYEPFSINNTVRSKQQGNDMPPSLIIAMNAFSEKKYHNSIAGLETILDSDPENSTVLFLLGMAKMEQKQYTEAINYFAPVRFNDENYYEDASWYMALAHLKKADIKEAKYLLDDLIKIKDGYYYKHAKELRSSLP